ncbi:MAG: YraN family protein [bacterium]|nr:YraN family protein [bacterium]
MQSKVTIGKKGEEEAVRYLKKRGYRIIERNFRCKLGEIDIIAIDKNYLVFIEVKKRDSSSFGNPLESVDEKKQKQIEKVALSFLRYKGLSDVDCRFDVVSITLDKIELIKDAFQI